MYSIAFQRGSRSPVNPPTQFEARKRIDTHTSQVPFTIETRLPPSSTPRSNRYRSQNDFESRVPKTLLFTDTPGHGKLRHYAFSALTDSLSPPTGVIFVVDAANLGSGSSGLSEAAEYLHDVLLVLQRAHSGAKSSKSREIPFLIAANKADLFTALPAPLARSALESEITKIRHTRARGLAGVETVGKSEGLGSGDSGMQEQDEEEPLGGLAESKFEFKVMEECNVHVEVVGGSAASTDDEGSDLEAWWDWIAAQL